MTGVRRTPYSSGDLSITKVGVHRRCAICAPPVCYLGCYFLLCTSCIVLHAHTHAHPHPPPPHIRVHKPRRDMVLLFVFGRRKRKRVTYAMSKCTERYLGKIKLHKNYSSFWYTNKRVYNVFVIGVILLSYWIILKWNICINCKININISDNCRFLPDIMMLSVLHRSIDIFASNL